MIHELGVKRDFFEALAKSVSYEITPDWLWPCNRTLVPMCQLAEHQSRAVFNRPVQNTNALISAASQLCSLFVTRFIYVLFMPCFGRELVINI